MLKCIKTFNEGGLQIAKGETYEGAQADYLLSNFPAHFERVVIAPAEMADNATFEVEVVEVKDVEAPEVDKAIKRPAKRK